ncbi:protein unc-13 homolog 4B-like [Palaemon carinicauda]|uniref:protein unc-13 homolog 4B-like n=1 Tax=Palaemon carinicauda TaxID=392227 RepID=UPI0035B602F8
MTGGQLRTSGPQNVRVKPPSWLQCHIHSTTEADLDSQEQNESIFYISQPASDVTLLPDAVENISEPKPPSPVMDDQDQSVLANVIYAVESLMGKTKQWLVPKGFTTTGSNKSYDNDHPKESDSILVFLDEVLETLAEAFSEDMESIQKLRAEAQQRQLAKLRLNLTIGEADIHTQIDTRESTKCLIRVTKGPKFKEVFETPHRGGTRNPRWKHFIEANLTDLCTDCIHLMLWEEREEEKKKKRHFMKGSTPEAPRCILLAELSLRAKDLLAQGITGWYDMENRFGETSKTPTRVHLSGHISCTSDVECDALGSYEILLKCLLDHERKKAPHDKKIGPCSDFKEDLVLGTSARAALRQFALVFNVSPASQCLSLWNNVTILHSPLDWQLLLTQFNSIKASLVVGAYSEGEQQRLSQSVSDVIDRCIACLKYLEDCFPAGHPHQSKLQLSFMLQTMKSIQTHPKIRGLLSEDKNFSLKSVIKAALQGFSKQWWNKIQDKLTQHSESKSEQLQSTLVLTEEVFNVLQNLNEFYDNIFIEEFDICCLKASYPVIVKEMLEAVEPIITEVCQSIPKSEEEIGEDGIMFDFLIGSTLMKIYKNIARIWLLRCPHLSSAIVEDTGIQMFSSFFEDGIENQLSLTQDREGKCIEQAIHKDILEPVSPSVHFSESLKEVRAIPHRFKIWWFEMVWPDQEDRAVFLLKILRSLLLLSISYCQGLSKKIDFILQESGTEAKEIANVKICVVITNMVTIMNDMKDYHNILGFRFLHSQTKEKYKKEIEVMVNMSTLNIQNIMQNFTWKFVNAREEFLEKTLMKLCQEGESLAFLTEVLYPTIDALRKFLDVSNAKIILENLWIKIIGIVKGIVDKENIMEPEFYGNLLKTLRKIYVDLTPESDEALDAESAETEDYKALVEDLSLMEKSSSSLISLYYKKQFEEQTDGTDLSTASLVIRTWFEEDNRLSVDVIMAKDIVVPPEEAHKAPLEYYVKVEVVTSEYQCSSEKTPVVKEDPATFDKLFEFNLDQNCDSEHEGTLILTLKDRNLTRSDTRLGESVIPFSSIPQGQCYARNRYLKMFLPTVNEGQQKILETLNRRDADKTASAFLKRLRKRHPEIADVMKSLKQ